jgi:hypothetical protein
MKYLSFDVGIKNLAYCVINTTTQSSTNEKHNMFEIADWQIINLVANKIKPNKLSCSHNVTTKRKCGVMTYKYYEKDNVKYGLCKNHMSEHKQIVSSFYKQCNNNNNCNDKKEMNNVLCSNLQKKTCKKQPINLYDNLGWLCEKHYDQNLKKQIAKHKIQKIQTNNANHESTFILATNLYDELETRNLADGIDEVLIENQPTLKNPIMKNIASLLYGYFVFKKIKSVRFISPLNKMKINQEISVEMLSKCQNKAETKKTTKKLGITFAKVLLHNTTFMKLIDKYEDKQDDLCDAFLQCYHYIYKNNLNFDIDVYNKITESKHENVLVLD